MRALVIGLREVARSASRDRREARAAPRAGRRGVVGLPGAGAAKNATRRSRSRTPGSSSFPRTTHSSRGFDKDTRYSVRRAEREGVEVSVVTDGDQGAIDDLHDLVGRDPGARRVPPAAPRALPDRLGSPGRSRPRGDPRGSARGRAARVGHGRDRGRPVLLPVQRLPARGARRAEALRELRAAVGDDATRAVARRPASRPVGRRSARRRTGPPVARSRALQEGLRRSRGGVGRIAGTSSWIRPCTGCAPRRASRAAGCEDCADEHGAGGTDRRRRPRTRRRHPGRGGLVARV